MKKEKTKFLLFSYPRRLLTYEKLVKAERYEKRKNQVFDFFISEAPPLPLWGNWESGIGI
ncbi:MAG: hypothetical protein PUD40_02900 [Bacteroidales bacterium]|nr:hypothetical protein [Bacteroidales bacterium]